MLKTIVRISKILQQQSFLIQQYMNKAEVRLELTKQWYSKSGGLETATETQADT